MSNVLAAISLPLWADVSQWVLLLALGFFLLLAYRQLAFMLRLKDIGSERDGLRIGEKAPIFSYIPVKSIDAPEVSFTLQGQWSILLFADPGCSSCQLAVSALEQLAPTLHGIQILVGTHADLPVIQTVTEFRDATIPVGRIPREVASKMYHTYTTPFGFVIDPDGVIRAKGGPHNEGSWRKLLRKANIRKEVHMAYSVE